MDNNQHNYTISVSVDLCLFGAVVELSVNKLTLDEFTLDLLKRYLGCSIETRCNPQIRLTNISFS